MGFDVYGRSGNQFRNSGWSWGPLWDYVEQVCSDILTKKDIDNGKYNDGHLIDADKAIGVGERLNELIKSGATARHIQKQLKEHVLMPDIICKYCDGKGKRKDSPAPKCNVCLGSGRVRPDETKYQLDIDNIQTFADFCIESDGYRIN